MKKSLFITVSICFALGLITARPLLAQNPNPGTAFPITGTAGFETGLQRLAYIEPPLGASDTASGVNVSWGDGSPDSMGLAQQRFDDSSGNFWVFGTHLYTQPKTYTVHITYQWTDCPTIFTCQTAGADLQTTATITAPGRFVILSIGDSIASGEGNPNEPNDVGGGQHLMQHIPNYPAWSFWDDAYSGYEGYVYPSDEANEWPSQKFPCHRSGYAGPSQAANTLVANNPGSDITFIHYACSGAAIEPGDTAATWTQDAVGQLKIARERLAKYGVGIDILLISAGSNSLYGPTTFGNGFGGLVKYCLNAKPTRCDVNNPMHAELTQSFSNLPTYYKNLAMEINCQQPPPFTGASGVQQDPDPSCTNPQKQIPKLVLTTEYMDPTHDANGNFPTSFLACPVAFVKLDYPGDFEFFKNGVVNPLNDAVDQFPVDAQNAGLLVPTYAVMGIGGSDFPGDGDAFLEHGVCAGSNRWVNDGHDSIVLLGEGPAGYKGEQDCSFANIVGLFGCGTEQLNGMLHPNSSVLAYTLGLKMNNVQIPPSCSPTCGHEAYSGQIFASIIQFNPPVTTPSATAGGNSYAFGTWTHESVAVSLSASNSIQQAGVGPTYYAVDNSACGSSFAQQSNLANVPGCSAYTGPFTIANSGKHSITFFSANASGYPIVTPAPFLNPPNAPLVPPLEGILQSVQVWVNKEPPVMTCTATPSVLWPPNNKMVPVRLNVTAVSALFGHTPFSLKLVTTSEGDAATDIHGFVVGQPSTAGSLLASRLGNEKTGRVYTFVYQSTDESGLTGTCTAKVLVPHDQRKSNP